LSCAISRQKKSGRLGRISPGWLDISLEINIQAVIFVFQYPSCIFAQNLLKIKMATNRTFTMIKPEAVAAGNSGKIIDMIIEAGYKIKAMKLTRLSKDRAGLFYEVHKERPFYGELVDYMSGGPIVAMALEKENAVADFRKLIGATDPSEAAEGTIRKRFAKSKGENAVHGSDSDENAAIEIAFHFADSEIVG
jgi:nucleoside-diphosphate kinase